MVPASGDGNRGFRKLSLGEADRRAGLAAGGVALVRQDVAVAIAVMHRDPPVRDRAVDAALEVAVADVKEVNAPERAAGLDLVANEYAEDLAAGFFIGERLSHEYTKSTKAKRKS